MLSTQTDIDKAISVAYAYGYRHFDTAVMYGNEIEIGNALIKYKIPRKEIFITSKVLPEDLTY